MTNPPATDPSAGRLWAFSLALYAKPGVAEACLALQDRLGVNVNLLLFCCWAGNLGHMLSGAQIDRLVRLSRPWQADIVEPLRAARRALKPMQAPAAQSLREAVRQNELEAERLQQADLATGLPLRALAAKPQAAEANLRCYLRRQGLAGEADAEIAEILGALG